MDKGELDMTTVVYKEQGKFLYKPVFDKSYDSTFSYVEGEKEATATSRIRIRAPYMDMLFGSPKAAGEFTEPIGSDMAEKEVLLGFTDDPASLKALEFIEKDEWIIDELDGKLVATGWFDNSIVAAVRELYSLVAGKEDVTLTLPIKGRMPQGKYCTDIPDFGRGVFRGGMDNDEGILTFCYGGVTKEDFTYYAETLEAHGFELYQENTLNNYGDIKNLFRTYVKDEKLVHISFLPADFLKADKEKMGEELRLYADHAHRPNGNEIRIVTDFSAFAVPRQQENVWTDGGIRPKISLVNLLNSPEAMTDNGMCITFTLADGSFIVIDGGLFVDAYRVHNALTAMNERKDGKIVVAAWVFTHAHKDHTTGFAALSMLERAKDIEIEKVIYTKEGDSYSWRTINDPYHYVYHVGNVLNETSMKACLRGFAGKGNTQFIHAHTGQRLYIRDAVLDVLYSGGEDLFPILINNPNDTCKVIKYTIGETTALIVGDAHKDTAYSALMPLFSGEVKCDILQIPHHGLGGPSPHLMPYIRPRIAMWCTTWKTIQLREMMKKDVGNAASTQTEDLKLNMVADTYVQSLPLPYNECKDETIRYYVKWTR